MTYDVLGPGALDYLPCRYGDSRLMFRGPKRQLAEPYVAFLGGTETYGKYIEKPFPVLIEDRLQMPCVNFGQANAGIDVFAQDPFIIEAAQQAEATVLQIVGAQNMTNRFYTVHPRRNDRFVGASELLETIYREVDFAEFHFTKHMLGHLYAISPDRFEAVRTELQEAWVARMKLLMRRLGGCTILLWFSRRAPDDACQISGAELGPDPLLVTREMIDLVRDHAAAIVEVVSDQVAGQAGTEGMAFCEMEETAAEQVLNADAHDRAALALAEAIEGCK